MKTKILLFGVILSFFVSLSVSAQVPVRKGWWKFDDAANMLKSEIGAPLVLTGTQISVPGPLVGNLATQIGKGSYLAVNHGIAANLGGTKVNEYSVQIDFSVPATGAWHSFIQTNPLNNGGGSAGDADLFTNTSNKIGTSTTGYSTNTIVADAWYRMIITVKNGEYFRVYINGELWLEKTHVTDVVDVVVDGRWSLENVLLLFADDDGDDATINCSEAGIWNVALTDAQVLELGDAATSLLPTRKGWWKFDDATNMLKAEIGSPLTLNAGGSQTSVPGPIAGNLATQIETGNYLVMTHGIAANLSGTKVNEYSVQIDFSVLNINTWHSFIQTNPTNNGGGTLGDADLFTNSTNKIGTGATGYSTNAILANTWYRMIISVKNGEYFRVYIDGQLWLEKALTAADFDGRWALENVLLLFADDDGDDATINCAEAGIWDVALSAAQAQELGNVTTLPVPSRKGWWKFDDATNMVKALIGSPLVLTGTQTSVAGPAAGNLATQLGIGSYLTMTHGIAANLSGTKVNEYSVQIDFSAPQLSTWHSFIQTNSLNNDDADLFINTSNKIGTSSSGYSTNVISVNTWYRMIISVKNGEFFRIYINGELWLDKALLPTDLDGRWSLENVLLLFADNDGDDATINCAEAAIWDKALTADQALKLGKAAHVVLVTGITVKSAGDATEISTVGGTLQMSADILPTNASIPVVLWTVVNGSGAATINSTGLVTASINGTVTVKATSTDGGNISGSKEITITNQPVTLVTSITVSSAGNVMSIASKGGTLQMSAVISPANATYNTPTWSVVNGTGEATISATGLLTAKKDGTVTVKATSKDAAFIVGSMDILLSNQSAVRARKGWWKFDDATDMLKATIGVPLTLTGTQTSVVGPQTGNLAVEVPLGSNLNMTHGISANGGGSFVNEWTLQMDFSVAMIDTWYAFFQTKDGDADLFIAKTAASDIGRVPNSIGCGSTYYTANTVAPNTWYRMLVAVKNGDGGFFKIYIDGVLWLDAAAQPIDGRYSLSAILMLFQDDDGDDGIIKCSEAGIWDVALTAGEAVELGKAVVPATGIKNLQAAKNNDLGQNYPNPFTASTTFPYQINEKGNVSFRILDLTGKELKVIDEGNKTPGSYTLELSSEKLNTGIYYLQMTTNKVVNTRKMMVIHQ